MDSVDVMGEVDTITAEQVTDQAKAEKEANLIAKGTYEGQVISWSKVEDSEKGEKSRFIGIPQYRVGIIFYDCPDEGRKKSAFFNFTTHKPDAEGQPKAAYTTMVGMFKALMMTGLPAPEVLEQAKVIRLKYRVEQFTPEGEETPINWLKSVSTI